MHDHRLSGSNRLTSKVWPEWTIGVASTGGWSAEAYARIQPQCGSQRISARICSRPAWTTLRRGTPDATAVLDSVFWPRPFFKVRVFETLDLKRLGNANNWRKCRFPIWKWGSGREITCRGFHRVRNQSSATAETSSLFHPTACIAYPTQLTTFCLDD